MSNKLYLARRARIRRGGEVAEVCGEWSFMVSQIVDHENAAGKERTAKGNVTEFFGYEIHPESEKFVNAPNGTVTVDADGSYRILPVGAECKVFDDEALANRLAEENKAIEASNIGENTNVTATKTSKK